ncbi:odorant receptor 43a-like [Photinus pyralis]|uniref:odorant receptor 43a-like n=1 Tax=Photinus pyralis TaxID=7054 RepID=UPI0012676745|nr:odorant receptor 43a-like [Photinus pyralis]
MLMHDVRWSEETEERVNIDRIMTIIHSEDFKARILDLLGKYIKHHQEFLQFCKVMDSYFIPLLFMKVCLSMFYHVFVPYCLLRSTELGLSLILVQYETCAFTEMLVFALVGQTLINKSEELRQNIFESPWYMCDVNYQKYILMLLMRTGRSTSVRVGKLAPMSLPMFLWILKTAFSYLTVLRQVTD